MLYASPIYRGRSAAEPEQSSGYHECAVVGTLFASNALHGLQPFYSAGYGQNRAAFWRFQLHL